jgi:hypothetical protein
MGVPRNKESRLFYTCALQRYDDAEVLLRAGNTTGAVYMAGYSIECILKALLLSSLPSKDREKMSSTFRGKWAHNYEELRRRYRRSAKGKMVDFPLEINRAFALVGWWSTELRYKAGLIPEKEAAGFLSATETILYWAKGRLGSS